MLETGFLAGVIAKLAGLGSVAKIAVATATAAATMTVAGVAAVLPIGGATSTDAAIEQAAGVVSAVTPVTSGESGVEASVETSAGPASTAAGASAAAPEIPVPPVPSLPVPPLPIPSVPGAGATPLPDLSGLSQIPTQVLSCLAPVLDLVKGLPAVSPAQVSQVGTAMVGCVSEIVEGLPLPSGLNACIADILGFVSTITSQLSTGGMPSFGSVGGFDMAACIPTGGLPVPGGLPGGMPFMGGGFPFGQ